MVYDVARRGVLDLLAVDGDGAALGTGEAGYSLDQLLLAVAVDARDAYDLACAHGEVEVAHGLDTALVLNHQVVDAEDLLAGIGGRLLYNQVDVVAHHFLRKLLLVHPCDVDRADVLAAADDGAGVGGGFDLLELVRDDDDRLALGGEATHDLDQAVDLLWGEDGGGLV